MKKLVIFTIVGLTYIQGLAQFGPQQIIDTQGLIPRYVQTADIDGDGDQDVVSAISGSDSTAWHENLDGQANFGPLQLISTNVQDVRFVTTTDIDGDGAEDVLTTCFGDDMILWNRNENGIGNFGNNQIIANDAIGATVCDAGDLDGDGDTDVVSANRNDNTVAWYENLNGSGSFGPEQVLDTGILNARFVLIRDIDGDNDNDVLAVSTGLARVFLFRNTDGNGNFTPPIELPGVAGGTVSMDAKDLDGDGDIDILVAASTLNSLYWIENTDGLGTFGPEITIDTRGSLVQGVYAEDLDADGDVDIVSITSDGEVAWYENTDGLGTFSTAQVISLDADNGRGIYAADLDGDGDNDVLSASITGNKIAWYENLTILGVAESQLKATILYPNPTKNIFKIETTATIKSIQLYNSAGQEISVVIQKNNQVDCTNLSAGIYTVVIEDTIGNKFSEKIVKE